MRLPALFQCEGENMGKDSQGVQAASLAQKLKLEAPVSLFILPWSTQKL